MVPSLPYTRVGQGQYGLYSPSEAPPLSTHQEWVEDIMGQQGFDNGERPIYTRRQVKNMLDAISDCFIESVVSQPYSISHTFSPFILFLMKIILGKRLE